MAEILANAIGIITGTIYTVNSINRIIEAVKDAPKQTRHLHDICVLVSTNLAQILTILKRKARHKTLSQTEKFYYDSIYKIVKSMKDDLIDIQENIPSQDEIKPPTIMSRLFKSKAAAALQLRFNVNDEAINRIDRSINVLHWTTTNLWQYEETIPPVFNYNFQKELRKFMQQLSDGETTYPIRVTNLLPAPPGGEQVDSLEFLRGGAFELANSLAIRSLYSGRNTPLEIIHSPSVEEYASTVQEQLEQIPLPELKYRYSEALSMMKYAKEQQFPDAAAEFGQEAVEIRRKLNDLEGVTSRSLEQFLLECQHAALLLSCLNRQSRENGRLMLERLTSDINDTAAPKSPENFDLTVAREEIGSIYYDLSEWNMAIRYLRAALLQDDSSMNNHDETRILRLARKICKAYEANMKFVDLRAFRRMIKDRIGTDPFSDPPSYEAALNWCRNNGFDVDTPGQLPSFIGVRDQSGDFPLHKAICDKDISSNILRQFCLDREALNAPGANGLAPLFMAVEQASLKAVSILLDEGASLDIRKPPGDFSDTVLHCCNDPGILELLLEKLRVRRLSSATSERGESINGSISSTITIDARNDLGNTPLLDACERNNQLTAKLLLERQADPNVPNHSGETPLIAVCYNGGNKADKRLIIEELISYGANASLKDRTGRHAREGLRQRGFSKLNVEAMLSTSNRGGSLDYTMATSGSTSISSLRVRSTDSGS